MRTTPRWMLWAVLAMACTHKSAPTDSSTEDVVTGATGSGTGAGDTGTPVGEPGPGAFMADFATSPAFFTRMSHPQEGEPHGEVQIYYSTNLRPLIEHGGRLAAPDGSVAIKRISQRGVVDGITVMIKRAGVDPDHQDWTYERRDADAELLEEGALDACIGCHQAFASTDYLAGIRISN